MDKKNSILISIFNIIFLLLICIRIFFDYFLHSDVDIFVWSNLSSYNWSNIYEFIISISLFITASVNILFIIQNRENKKFNISHLIIAIFTIVFLINKYIFLGITTTFTIYHIINCIYVIAYIMAIIIQLISLKSNSIVYNSKKKTTNIFMGLFILSTIILLVITILYYSLTYNEVIKRSTYKNAIINNISTNFEEYTGTTYKEYKRNGKIGYTIKGKNSIPCIYTYSSGFDIIYINGKLYALAVVIENGSYKLLSTNSNTIDLGINPLDIEGFSDFEPLQRILFLLQDNIMSAKK